MTRDKIKKNQFKKNESTQVNSTNLRPEIWNMNSPTKRKAEQITKLKASKSMSNEKKLKKN
jgi:hypothetical protein